jgi:5-methyltetrahydrofolate--homocysteine methyltransferase
VNDDLPFVAAPFTNMAWMEAILGCRIVNMGNSLYAEMAVKDWDSWHWRAPNLENNLWACKLLEMTSSLVERSRGRFFVGQTLMRGVTDMLSALRGASLFVLDFYDYPETVQRAAALCADTFIQIAHAQLDLIPASDIGYCAGAQPLWAPEKIVWLQEDAMALISPTLFRRYILPEDRRILRQFPYTAFHLHGSSLWAVDILMEEENLNILELHDDSGQVNHEAILQTWKRIQTRKPVVASKIYDSQPSFLTWLDRVFTELSPAGLMFIIDVPSSIEGEMVRQWFLEKAARLAQE